MKKLFKSAKAKAAAFILLFLFMITGVLSAVGVEAAYNEVYNGSRLYELIYNYRYVFLSALAVSAIAIILLLIFIIGAAGHRKYTDEIVLNKFDKIPLEITALFVLIPFLILTVWESDILLIAACAVSVIMLIPFLQTLSARIKYGKWYKNSIIFNIALWFCKLLKRLISIGQRFFLKLPVIYKTILLYAGFIIINLALSLLFIMSDGFFLFLALLIVIDVAVLAALCLFSVGIQKIKNVSRLISQGKFDVSIDRENMLLDFKDIADNLNNISIAIAKAVETATKSERMKAELITNVSHDIKTPLTSIISYVDLLKKENIKDEKALEYIEVLDRQSAHLKKLTYDLIDASKASTGNVEINLQDVDVVEFVNQAAGEYSERFTENGLAVILNIPQQSIYIRADGKLLWRIIDNLLGNACKYSQENTRVYISVNQSGSKAVISIKNISRDVLNINGDELTERFVRGDSSRNTEGSGLGLSIAKSLAELQNGSLSIDIDCDLFKAEVAFEVKSPAEE